MSPHAHDCKESEKEAKNEKSTRVIHAILLVDTLTYRLFAAFPEAD
jgi:hypothetical protein